MIKGFVPTSVLLIVLLIAALVICIWFFGFNPLKKVIPAATPVDVDSRIILLNQLRKVKQLTTTIGSVVTIVASEQSKQILGINVGSAKLLYVAVGKVRAGVDLEKMNVGDIDFTDGRPSLVLPPAEIFDVSIDTERSRILDTHQSLLCAPDGFALQPAAEQAALTEIRETALKTESILETASIQAAAVMEALGFDVASS